MYTNSYRKIKNFFYELDQQITERSADAEDVYRLSSQFFCLTKNLKGVLK